MATVLLDLGSAANGRVQVWARYDDVSMALLGFSLKNLTHQASSPACVINGVAIAINPAIAITVVTAATVGLTGIVLTTRVDEKGNTHIVLPGAYRCTIPFAGDAD